MAVAMFMRWSGVTSDQYDTVMARLELDANRPAGGVLHVAALTDEGLEALRSYPHAIIAPCAALSLTLLAFNFLGDGLRDAADPYGR